MPAYDPERETRLAVVMYGGVSLAIYMYGVAEELRHLVCSTAAAHADRSKLREPVSTEEVYRKMARVLDGGDVRTRFVVDIIAGTSAGGINGICLAKALANDAPIQPLEQVWLEQGDIAGLVNDELSGRDYTAPPTSLLNGRHMQRQLVEAFAGMEGAVIDGSSSALVDQLDLWVTATDLEGLPVALRLANATATERRHGNRYHFRHRGANKTDFGPENNLYLAYAARASSAFPFAFAPAVLSGLEEFFDTADGDWIAAMQGWDVFHRDYASAQPAFAGRSFSDGGILDNKPFSSATESLVMRTAQRPVQRKLVYVEPDPSQAVGAGGPAKSWNALQTVQAASLSIPRVETIREDIQTVLARNREIERLRDVVSSLELSADQRARLLETDPASAKTWMQRTLREQLDDPAWGPTYAVYHRLKVRSVVDWLAGVIAGGLGVDSRSDHVLALHQLVRVWKERGFGESPGGDAHKESENAFLVKFDAPYRDRRLAFVAQKLKELTGPDPLLAERLLAACGLGDVSLETLGQGSEPRELHAGIDAARRILVDAREEPLDRKLLERLDLTPEHLNEILDGGDDAGMRRAATAVFAPRRAALQGLADTVAARLHVASDASRDQIEELLSSSSPLRRALRVFYEGFEAYDLALYPLTYGTSLGETNPVDIVRISPLDARGPYPETHERESFPLKGKGVHHFGAFLDREWRLHDIVWGRLDAAECLIDAILGPDHVERDALVASAHARILAEYAAKEPNRKDDPWERLTQDDAGTRPDRERVVPALQRAQRVAGTVLAHAVSARNGAPTAVGAAINAVFGNVAPGKAVWRLLGQRPLPLVLGWLAIALVLGLACVLLFDLPAPGWILAGAALGAAGMLLVALHRVITAARAAVQDQTRRAIFGGDEQSRPGAQSEEGLGASTPVQ